MANEITVVAGLGVTNGLLSKPVNTQTKQFTQTTARGGIVCQDIGTSEENISFGDGVPGEALFTNLDSSNFVRLRFHTGENAIRLRPNGGKALFYIDGVTVIAIADTATCKVAIEWVNT